MTAKLRIVHRPEHTLLSYYSRCCDVCSAGAFAVMYAVKMFWRPSSRFKYLQEMQKSECVCVWEREREREREECLSDSFKGAKWEEEDALQF